MSGVSQLIDVTFKDNTSYANVSGNDVVGVLIDHCWGPAGELGTYSYSEFMETYPEALPYGWSASNNINDFYSYAQAKQALSMGASYLEVFRVQGNWKYLGKKLKLGESSLSVVKFGESNIPSLEKEDLMSVYLRYPGYPSCNGELVDFKSFAIYIKTSVSEAPITVEFLGERITPLTDDSLSDKDKKFVVIERFEGSANPNELLDGVSYYIINVINSNSKYLRSIGKFPTTTIPFAFEENVTSESFNFPVPSMASESDWGVSIDAFKTAMENVFEDPETSNASILIAPMSYVESGEKSTKGIYDAMKNVVTSRKDACALHGYSLEGSFDKDAITLAHNNAGLDMFNFWIAGRESMTIFNNTIILDGTAGWAGRMVAIAEQVHINQLPSAKTYGGYPGKVVSTLKFSDVITLHDKSGVNSIYSTHMGNYIWGIKNCHPRQDSYFAKANVTRVVNWLLKYTYPIVMSAIHTETVSDDLERAKLLSRLNQVVSTMIGQGNIKDASTVDIESDDAKTNGGEILIIYFNIYFKKLTERCRIQITATDNSVSATIS